MMSFLSLARTPLLRWTLASVAAVGCLGSVASAKDITLLNVSYDPTREFYKDYNALFAAYWKAKTGDTVTINQSHGGSGAQARSVIDGNDADVVTLGISTDIDAIAAKTGKVPANWATLLPHNATPYTSTVVFLVRKGNPKNIKDWPDLDTGDVQIITPNPKTSSGGRWSFLAAYGWALRHNNGDTAKAQAYITDLYKRVPVLDTGARGSTTSFAQRGLGDVLIAWENEAYLAQHELGADKFDVVIPSESIVAEPPIAVVTGNSDKHGTTDVAKAYLEYLYSPDAQKLAAHDFYRPHSVEAANPEDLKRFAKIPTFTVADVFGSIAKAQKDFFEDGGLFDKLYQPAK